MRIFQILKLIENCISLRIKLQSYFYQKDWLKIVDIAIRPLSLSTIRNVNLFLGMLRIRPTILLFMIVILLLSYLKWYNTLGGLSYTRINYSRRIRGSVVRYKET